MLDEKHARDSRARRMRQTSEQGTLRSCSKIYSFYRIQCKINKSMESIDKPTLSNPEPANCIANGVILFKCRIKTNSRLSFYLYRRACHICG